jgi:hypothetical protein
MAATWRRRSDHQDRRYESQEADEIQNGANRMRVSHPSPFRASMKAALAIGFR